MPSTPRARLLVLLALPVVWLTFGATFVAIKVGVSTVPPFVFSGSRFVLAGALLLGWCALRAGGHLGLRRRDLGVATLTGGAMIFLGQGSVTWASTELNPGIVAMLVSTVPLWAALMARLVLGTRIPAVAGVGLTAGFAGICLLAFPTSSAVALVPALAVSGGAVAWAAGTLVVAGSEMRRRPLLLAAIQMLTGGALQLLAGAATGEASHVHLATLTPKVVAAFVFTVVLTGLIGFTLFAWLIGASSPAIANSQAFVVPVVSLLLGALLLAEALTARTVVASAISLFGVALLVVGQSRSGRASQAEVSRGEPRRHDGARLSLEDAPQRGGRAPTEPRRSAAGGSAR